MIFVHHDNKSITLAKARRIIMMHKYNHPKQSRQDQQDKKRFHTTQKKKYHIKQYCSVPPGTNGYTSIVIQPIFPVILKN